MSRVVVINHLTLDGVMQAPGRREEDTRGGFEHGGWAGPSVDEVVNAAMGARMPRSGGLLLGRRSYEDMLGYWNTAIVARALVRLSRSFITDVPLGLLAAAAFALTVFASASFALVLLAAGLAYEVWTNSSRWARRAQSVALGPAAIVAVAAGAVTLSLTAEIFWEGLRLAWSPSAAPTR